MKIKTITLTILITALFLSGCNALWNLGDRMVTPSDVIITETRPVSDFTAIDFTSWGRINLSQGTTESLTITGADNLVPLVETTVSNGTLNIDMEAKITAPSLNRENVLTFDIVVKDLSSLMVSGLGDIKMDSLTTSSLALEMSGAGNIELDQLTADSLDIDVSGLGSVKVSGEVKTATIEISGAGSVDAPDLKIETASVSVPGLGSATVWVTDELTGDISGAGSVNYYGNPQVNTNSSGLGSFKPMGNK